MDKIPLDDDNYGGQYEPTDSEDEYNEEEKELLEEHRKGHRRDEETEKELLAFGDSDDDSDENQADGDDDDDDDDDDEDEIGELMHDSDIEGAGDDDVDLPDSRDWGKDARAYYNTDFVDPDYDTYNEKEEQLAKLEEEEALAIQKRMYEQMTEDDFLLTYDPEHPLRQHSDADEERYQEETTVQTDFSGLSKRERLMLLQEDSPEFLGITADFEKHLSEVDTIIAPVLKYVSEHNVPMIPALEFAQLYQNITLTYCSNITFYLLLKAKRIPIKSHPITQRLVQLAKVLKELKDKYDNIIKPQLEALLERIVDGDEFEVLAIPLKKTKKKLSILDRYNADSEHRMKTAAVGATTDSSEEDDNEDEDEAMDETTEDIRRGITYQIAKNKGLTPHRKKELRNPRVKNRGKFRKALIRRKGAVRTVRKETRRYDGELSGIKASVIKSVKFKV